MPGYVPPHKRGQATQTGPSPAPVPAAATAASDRGPPARRDIPPVGASSLANLAANQAGSGPPQPLREIPGAPPSPGAAAAGGGFAGRRIVRPNPGFGFHDGGKGGKGGSGWGGPPQMPGGRDVPGSPGGGVARRGGFASRQGPPPPPGKGGAGGWGAGAPAPMPGWGGGGDRSPGGGSKGKGKAVAIDRWSGGRQSAAQQPGAFAQPLGPPPPCGPNGCRCGESTQGTVYVRRRRRALPPLARHSGRPRACTMPLLCAGVAAWLPRGCSCSPLCRARRRARDVTCSHFDRHSTARRLLQPPAAGSAARSVPRLRATAMSAAAAGGGARGRVRRHPRRDVAGRPGTVLCSESG